MGKARCAWLIALPLLILALSSNLLAQAAASTTDAQTTRITRLEQQIADAKGSADNAWMLTSAALVLMMTGPGLALFYGGLVRKKNVLSTMMQSFALMAIVTVLWAIVGYSLAFGPGNSFIGGLAQSFLAWSRDAARCGLCSDDSGADFHGVSVDVCHHHAGPDHWRLRRTHEVQCHGSCS